MPMLDHLRAHHRAIERGVRQIQESLKKVADTALDERGHAVVHVEDVGVHVVVSPEHNLVIFKSFINFLPDPASGKVLPLYYHLLDMNDEPDTGLTYFSIVASEEMDAEQDIISVETKRPIADISHEEFEICLATVGEVGTNFTALLEEQFSAPRITR